MKKRILMLIIVLLAISVYCVENRGGENVEYTLLSYQPVSSPNAINNDYVESACHICGVDCQGNHKSLIESSHENENQENDGKENDCKEKDCKKRDCQENGCQDSVSQAVVNDVVAKGLLTHSQCGLLMDASSGKVLYEKNADERRPIASMVKIMTLNLVFDAIEEGKIKMTDDVLISEKSASMGGSQAFLDMNSTYTVETLIKSIIIASANDSCVALAEHISGSVENFVSRMNEKAKELNMENTNFNNCTGLPDSTAYSSAKDTALMTLELCKHNDYFKYSKIWMEDLVHSGGRITTLTNTNKLSRFYQGCEGGKTGYTNEAKHCLSAIASRNNMRLISVVLAGEDSKMRFQDASELLNYGFSNYESKVMLSSGQAVGIMNVTNGKNGQVEIVASRDLRLFGERGKTSGEVKVEYIDRMKAPIRKGEVVGKAYLICQGVEVDSVELIAKEEVKKLTLRDVIDRIINSRNK